MSVWVFWHMLTSFQSQKISKSAPWSSPVILSWSSSSFRSRRSQNSSAAPFCRTAAKATWRSARRRGEAKRRARPSVLTAAMTRARSSWRLSFKGDEGRTGGWGWGEHGGWEIAKMCENVVRCKIGGKWHMVELNGIWWKIDGNAANGKELCSFAHLRLL